MLLQRKITFWRLWDGLHLKLPILFIVEDNNLSILTEKKTRRHWEMHDVAKGFKMKSYNIDDNPLNFLKNFR